jgi:hypothetical protein
MDSPLPSNQDLIDFSAVISWDEIEQKREKFSEKLRDLIGKSPDAGLSLDVFSDALGVPVTTHFDANHPEWGNVILAHQNKISYVLGSMVSARYRGGQTLLESIVPYNLNPGVNHTNLHETSNTETRIRALGAEIELGLLHRDGSPPEEEELQEYIRTYKNHAQHLGITRQVDREACQYQIEVHVAPGVGYHRTRASLDGIMTALMSTSETTDLQTAIMSSYPVKSDFKLYDNSKVKTAVDLMVEVNDQFPQYVERLDEVKERYNIDAAANSVEVFRLQGCHIHLDLAGRSEALGLLVFYTMLRSATAIANSAMLKGGPFVNGTCDAELLCTREYLRSITVTGRHIEMPLSPHLVAGHMERYAGLLKSERANAVARALLYDDGLGSPTSAMHSILGRVRSDLLSSNRICTLESTGMPVNASAARQAAVLTDFEYTHALVEEYFRNHGCDLEPMYDDRELWAIVGPLDTKLFQELHHKSDRECSDITLTTAAGTSMTLAEFYEMKRIYMHQHLPDSARIRPKDIDTVYHSLQRMLEPPSGRSAQTIEQYIHDFKLRSTGNWGRILRDAFIEEGGVPGTHNPHAVLSVTNRVHDALRVRYLQR